jgi:hypothetical protein
MESGLDVMPGTPGATGRGAIVGPGYSALQSYDISGNTYSIALIYPLTNYISSAATGTNPLSSAIPGTSSTYATTTDNMAYVAPFAGSIVGMTLNSLSWFSNAISSGDAVPAAIVKKSATINLVGFGFPVLSGATLPVWGYSATVTNGSFAAGDVIYVAIRSNSGTWSLPQIPQTGIVNITLYLKFNA